MRQPRISGRTFTIMQHSGNIITQSDPEGYKRVAWPSRHDKLSWLSMAQDRVYLAAEDKDTATAWCGSIPRASGWATDPSTLWLQILAKVEDESSPKIWPKHEAREYIVMHSARIATYYKQSNNHAARHTLEIKSTHGKSLLQADQCIQLKRSMALQANMA